MTWLETEDMLEEGELEIEDIVQGGSEFEDILQWEDQRWRTYYWGARDWGHIAVRGQRQSGRHTIGGGGVKDWGHSTADAILHLLCLDDQVQDSVRKSERLSKKYLRTLLWNWTRPHMASSHSNPGYAVYRYHSLIGICSSTTARALWLPIDLDLPDQSNQLVSSQSDSCTK